MSFAPLCRLTCKDTRKEGPWRPLSTGRRRHQVSALRPPHEPSTIVLAISRPIARADVPGLCGRVRVLLEGSDADLVVCDVGGLDADAVTVDALARLQLTARRLGCRLRLRHACDELQELLVLVGLNDVVPLCAESPLQPRGQTEERKEARGVEEEADPADPTGR
jgi:ABC-type transporter Mla MlaB component